MQFPGTKNTGISYLSISTLSNVHLPRGGFVLCLEMIGYYIVEELHQNMYNRSIILKATSYTYELRQTIFNQLNIIVSST